MTENRKLNALLHQLADLYENPLQGPFGRQFGTCLENVVAAVRAAEEQGAGDQIDDSDN